MYEISALKVSALILAIAVGLAGFVATVGIVLNMQPSKDYRLMKVCLATGQQAKACSDAIYGPPGLPK